MKKTLILLALIIFVSCSKDDINEPSNCGVITSLTSGTPTPNCQDGFRVGYLVDNNFVRSECITEQRFNRLEIGGQFCGTITISN